MRITDPVVLAVLLNAFILLAPLKSLAGKKCTCLQLKNCSAWSKDFTEVQFTPENIIYLEDNIKIENVRNFSLAGKSSSRYTTFECKNLSSFIITNSSFIEIQNIRIVNCGKNVADYTDIFPSVTSAAIYISKVSSIRLTNVTIENSCGHGIVAVNVVGMFLLENIEIHGNVASPSSCNNEQTLFGGLLVLNLWKEISACDESVKEDTTINIVQCSFYNIRNKVWPTLAQDENETLLPLEYINSSAAGIILHQFGYHIDVKIVNTYITNINAVKAPLIFFSYSTNGTSNITIFNSTIVNTNTTYSAIEISFKVNDTNLALSQIQHTLTFADCRFLHNSAYSLLRMAKIPKNGMELKLNNVTFKKNLVKYMLRTQSTAPILYGNIEFSSNKAISIIKMSDYLLIDDDALVNFIDNRINLQYSSKRKRKNLIVKEDISLLCPIQFLNDAKVKITFKNNRGYGRLIYGNPLLGCSWIPSFKKRTALPSEIYSRVINLIDQNITNGLSGRENSVCHCGINRINCLKVKLDPVCPGQSVALSFIHFNFDIALYTNFTEKKFNGIAPTCNISSYDFSSPKIDLIFQHCTNVSYIIKASSPQDKTCLLLLSTATKEQTLYAFKVELNTCPLGFVLNHSEGICKCDPKLLLKLRGLSCDISSVTFGRPANTWISNNSKGVIYASYCHFDYCQPYPSLVQLANPDIQCFPGRSGIACGECAQGLSAVFGTSLCKRCSNYWLFLLPVYAIAGLLLVLALFVLNLTVVDGDIYGFILMVNGLSIHKTRLFPSDKSVSWILVSFSNLDLGFEVCFYNGMTSYVATWLRFMFPIYVLLIVATMVFASRYFPVIEKLTRKRAIPVITTLYLLSYNKLMVVTFRGLFSYTTIHHLYDTDKDVYWSVDTSIPLFGVKFTFLFIFCLFVFLLVIIPTNVLFVFSKVSYRYKFVVNYLKPFLDAYHAPFRENCSYFLGIELLMRVMLYACTSFSAQNIGAIFNALIVLYLAYLCQVKPFKSMFNSILYCSYIIYCSGFIILFMRFLPVQPRTYDLIFNSIVCLGLLEFLGVVLIHVWKYILCNFKIFINFENHCKGVYKTKFSRRKTLNNKQHIPLVEVDCYENFQEELLALSP